MTTAQDDEIETKTSTKPITWEQCVEIVRTNNLEAFYRSPPVMKLYKAKKDMVSAKNISIFKQLIVNELKWVPEEALALPDDEIKFYPKSNKLLSSASDILILPNEFNYFLDDGIKHVLVWSKLAVPSDPLSEMGDVSAETRKIIDKYIHKTFVEKLGIAEKNILWFRNWSKLQSVKAISHVHVLVNGLSKEQMDSLIGTPGAPLSDEELGPSL